MRLALLVVLQRLTPAERVVFVLHDIFQVPFDEVAATVGRSAPACRQLARRARQKTGEGSAAGRLDVRPAEHRRVTDKFIAACATGDLQGLLDKSRVAYQRSVPSSLAAGTVAFAGCGSGDLHGDFVTRAWRPDPLKYALSLIPGYMLRGRQGV